MNTKCCTEKMGRDGATPWIRAIMGTHRGYRSHADLTKRGRHESGMCNELTSWYESSTKRGGRLHPQHDTPPNNDGLPFRRFRQCRAILSHKTHPVLCRTIRAAMSPHRHGIYVFRLLLPLPPSNASASRFVFFPAARMYSLRFSLSFSLFFASSVATFFRCTVRRSSCFSRRRAT